MALILLVISTSGEDGSVLEVESGVSGRDELEVKLLLGEREGVDFICIDSLGGVGDNNSTGRRPGRGPRAFL